MELGVCVGIHVGGPGMSHACDRHEREINVETRAKTIIKCIIERVLKVTAWRQFATEIN